MPLDAIVVGGGPAGSSAAAALRRAGSSVTLLESDRFPRFHIGESLLQQANVVFDRIGFQPVIHRSGFVPKFGACFVDERGEQRFTYDFGELLGNPRQHTWQVPRAEFDAMLLDHAQRLGAEVRQARAKSARFDADGVEVELEQDGASSRLRARYLVDASGRAGFLARQFGLRQPDPELQKVAAYAHYRGIARPGEGRRAGDIQIVSCADMNWFWFIPLPDGVTSVGIVADFDRWQRDGKPAPEALLAQALARYPVTAAWTGAAERIGPVRFESTFSYATKAYAGARWILAGDAAAFLDPVFSSGVMFAMYGGVDAAEAIRRARGGALAVRALDRRLRRRYEFVRRFVAGFYDPWFRDFYFAPTRRLGLVRAVTGVLAGIWEPSLLDRLRLRLFLRFTRLQRRRAIVPRLHLAPEPAR
jgi:flavin-dependent dehydrogenase